MSKKKSTPLRKFLGVINENSENFQDKNFLEFLNERGENLLKKEKKVIEKSFFAGFDKSIDIFEISQPENRKETCRALDLAHEYYSENFKSYFLKELVDVDEKILMKNDLSEENKEKNINKKLDFINEIFSKGFNQNKKKFEEDLIQLNYGFLSNEFSKETFKEKLLELSDVYKLIFDDTFEELKKVYKHYKGFGFKIMIQDDIKVERVASDDKEILEKHLTDENEIKNEIDYKFSENFNESKTPETSESIKGKLEDELKKNGINFKTIKVIEN
jgi:hypothetical protein